SRVGHAPDQAGPPREDLRGAAAALHGVAVTRVAVALCAGILLAAAPAAEARAPRPIAATGPLRHERLSDERTVTRWANPVRTAPIRAHPSGRSRRVARLRALTEDGVPEVYLALRSHRVRSDRVWIRVRIPG